jgi:orotate phosphoribosyltransferase
MEKIIQQTKERAIKLLYQQNAVRIDLERGFAFDPEKGFTDKGNIKSPVYFNLGVLENDPATRFDIASALHILLANNHDFEAIVGVVSGGISWASSIANSRMLPLIRVHGQPKEYGLCNHIDGELPKDGVRVLIIDDAVTTGQNALNVVNALRAVDNQKRAYVTELYAIFDWHFPFVDEQFYKAGVQKTSLTSFEEVLDYGFVNKLLPEEAKTAIEQFLTQWRQHFQS